jgi:hypothetical protein
MDLVYTTYFSSCIQLIIDQLNDNFRNNLFIFVIVRPVRHWGGLAWVGEKGIF